MDSYSVAEAARIIGRSPKRVRQLIEAGSLPTVPDSSPVRVPADAVHRERDKRRNLDPSTPGPKPEPERVTLDLDTLLAFAESQTQKAIEATTADREAAQEAHRRVEETLRESLAEARARAEAAERRAAEAQAEAAALREKLDTLDAISAVSTVTKKETGETLSAEETRDVTDKKRRRWWKSS